MYFPPSLNPPKTSSSTFFEVGGGGNPGKISWGRLGESPPQAIRGTHTALQRHLLANSGILVSYPFSLYFAVYNVHFFAQIFEGK